MDLRRINTLCKDFRSPSYTPAIDFSSQNFSSFEKGRLLLVLFEKLLSGCSLPKVRSFCIEHLNLLLTEDKQPLLSQGASDPTLLYEAYQRRISTLQRFAKHDLDSWFTRFYLYHFLSHWVVEEESLVLYMQQTLVRTFMMRLFLAAHPKSQIAMDTSNPTYLEEAMTDTMYNTARIFEHCNISTDNLKQVLQGSNPQTLLYMLIEMHHYTA